MAALQIVLVVGDGRLGTALPADVELVRGRGRGQHPSLHTDCQVERCLSDAACRSEDHHPIPFCDLGNRSQSVIRGAVGDAERRRGGEVRAVGNQRTPGARRAAPAQRMHRSGWLRIPGRPARTALRRTAAGGHHLTGEFAARGERHRNLDLVLAGDQQHIGKVDSCGVDAHQQLTRAWCRIGDVIDNQIFWRAVGAAHDGAHQPAPSPRKQNRTK